MTPSPLSALLSLAVLLLASPHYPHREASHRTLEALLPLSLPHLEALAQSPDLEAQTRAQQIVERYRVRWCRQQARTLRPRGRGKTPWIDMLRHGDLPGVWRYVDHQHYLRLAGVRKSGDSEAPHWEPHRRATQLFLFERLCDGWDVERVQFVLDRMGEEESRWVQMHGTGLVPWEMPWGKE